MKISNSDAIFTEMTATKMKKTSHGEIRNEILFSKNIRDLIIAVPENHQTIFYDSNDFADFSAEQTADASNSS